MYHEGSGNIDDIQYTKYQHELFPRPIASLHNHRHDENNDNKNITKGLTPDQKKLHWEAYAKKTERQEEMFKKVFNDVFGKQAKEISDYYEKHGQLPTLNDEETAKRFEAALRLTYEDAFEGDV